MANSHSIDLEKGSSQYLSISDGSIDLQEGANMTWSFWLNPESLAEDDMIMSKRVTSGDQRSFRFTIPADTSAMIIQLSVDGAAETASTTATGIISTGSWQHFCITFDGTQSSGNRLKIYKNGASFSLTDNAPSTVFASSADLLLGTTDGIAFFYDGLMDDVRIYARTLTSAEAGDLYNNFCVGATSLRAWWEFNNATTDSSGNGYTLTNNNSATFSTDVPFSSDCSTFTPRACFF